MSANNGGFNLQTMGNGKDRGGTCSGDSGGPIFYPANTNNIVAVTSFGLNSWCRGVDFSYRVDRAEVAVMEFEPSRPGPEPLELKPPLSGLVRLVGEGGFEPPTSCTQSRCASAAPLPGRVLSVSRERWALAGGAGPLSPAS